MIPERSVILLEFNELAPSLVKRFIDAGELPNFARLYRESRIFTTDAEESGPTLQPWVLWVTIHSGVPAATHGIRELGEGQKLKQKSLTELVAEADRRVWVCGSMNTRHGGKVNGNGCVLPDPWTADVAPHPDELLPYYRFIQKNVQEHAATTTGLRPSDYVSFLRFMLTHGLTPSTIVNAARQLMQERGGKYKWKRVAVLDRLQCDVFRWYYKRLRPHFSTFFLNSTAHLQHKYWRNLEPELFKIKPQPEEQKELSGAVLFGYQQMDKVLGRFLDMADDDTVLILCTALSQQPCLIYEDIGGKTFYRAHDIRRLLSFAGVTAPFEYAPVMSEEFHLQFESEEAATAAARQLESLRVDGDPAVWLRLEGRGILAGCHVFRDIPQEAVLERGAGHSCRFYELFYRAGGLKSGMHHPEGMLWIRLPDRTQRIQKDKVSLLSVAPTVLRLLGLTPPDTMAGTPLVEASDAATVAAG
jgi:hypothetical protein